jgi:hypothetical protein
MNKKKNIIIVLGLGLLIFMLLYGTKVYYQDENMYASYTEKINEIIEPAQLESENCLTGELESGYRICCAITQGIKEGLFYDCTSQEYFEPNQLVRLIFDPSRFNFNYDTYYLGISSGLYNEEGVQIDHKLQDPLMKKTPNTIIISGRTSQDPGLFTLLKLGIYPDISFFEKDYQTILNLQAEIIE